LVRTTLEELEVSYAYSSGHLTPIGLFELLAENESGVIVLDDLTALFSQPDALQLLLAALGNQIYSKGRPIRYKTAKGDRRLSFSGGIIFISNRPLDSHSDEVLAALDDRVFVLGYEPSDEQIVALIYHIADRGVRGISANECRTVATFLIDGCRCRNIRPSMRLFLDKALRDYEFFAAGNSETDWRDLIVSNLEQRLVEPQHPGKELNQSLAEAERRIALDVSSRFATREERVAAWKEQTGKSQATLYRRISEVRRNRVIEDRGRSLTNHLPG
jgi:hypothetical protein